MIDRIDCRSGSQWIFIIDVCDHRATVCQKLYNAARCAVLSKPLCSHPLRHLI